MTYQLYTDVQSKNYYTPAQCLKHYGMSRTVGGYTIHHWGTPNTGLEWDSVRRYLSRAGGNTSAHYVVDAGKVAYIVDDTNAAWHAGSAVGNARTIGIEVNPNGGDAVYETVAKLLRDLWDKHGDVQPVYPHRHWTATDCPGDLDLSRMVARAVDLRNFKPASPVVGTFKEDDMVQLIIYFYEHLYGRTPSTDEVMARLDDQAGKTPAEIRDWFLAGSPKTEPGVTVMAFRDYVHHDPNQDQINEQSAKASVRQVRHDVSLSPEALGTL